MISRYGCICTRPPVMEEVTSFVVNSALMKKISLVALAAIILTAIAYGAYRFMASSSKRFSSIDSDELDDTIVNFDPVKHIYFQATDIVVYDEFRQDVLNEIKKQLEKEKNRNNIEFKNNKITKLTVILGEEDLQELPKEPEEKKRFLAVQDGVEEFFNIYHIEMKKKGVTVEILKVK